MQQSLYQIAGRSSMQNALYLVYPITLAVLGTDDRTNAGLQVSVTSLTKAGVISMYLQVC